MRRTARIQGSYKLLVAVVWVRVLWCSFVIVVAAVGYPPPPPPPLAFCVCIFIFPFCCACAGAEVLFQDIPKGVCLWWCHCFARPPCLPLRFPAWCVCVCVWRFKNVCDARETLGPCLDRTFSLSWWVVSHFACLAGGAWHLFLGN